MNDLKEKLVKVDPRIRSLKFQVGPEDLCINKEVIQLKNPNQGELSVYVALHLSALALSDEIGHTKKWISIFKSFLQRAQKLGIYATDKN